MGMWHVTYVRLFSKEIAGLCGGERSTLLRHSDNPVIEGVRPDRDKVWGRTDRSGPGEGFRKGFAERKERGG
jgi:hypothetical protein